MIDRQPMVTVFQMIDQARRLQGGQGYAVPIHQNVAVIRVDYHKNRIPQFPEYRYFPTGIYLTMNGISSKIDIQWRLLQRGWPSLGTTANSVSGAAVN